MKAITTFTLAFASFGIASGAGAQQLTFAHGFNSNHYWYTQIVDPWMTCVQEKSDREVTFDHYPSGQIVGHNDALDAINNGLSSISPIAIGYETDKMPLNGLTMLPAMGETSVQMATAYRKMLTDRTALYDEFIQQGVHPLIVSLLPVYQLQSTGKPVESLDALSGAVIRSAGGALTLTIDALGAASAEISIPDLYIAMQNGTVDGALSAHSSIKPFSLEEQLKSISTNGEFGSFATVLVMDNDTYGGLSDSARKVINDCSAQIEIDMAKYLDADNAALEEEFAGMGITMYEFPEDMLTEMAKRIAPVTAQYVERLNQRGLPATATYEAYLEALGKS